MKYNQSLQVLPQLPHHKFNHKTKQRRGRTHFLLKKTAKFSIAKIYFVRIILYITTDFC